MDRLKLHIVKHPNPYTIGWIKVVRTIKMIEQYQVPFSIGRYKDEMYCDIVEMDAGHLLLFRFWQYNIDATHLGKVNLYKMKKDGFNYTLTSLRWKTPSKTFKQRGEIKRGVDFGGEGYFTYWLIGLCSVYASIGA